MTRPPPAGDPGRGPPLLAVALLGACALSGLAGPGQDAGAAHHEARRPAYAAGPAALAEGGEQDAAGTRRPSPANGQPPRELATDALRARPAAWSSLWPLEVRTALGAVAVALVLLGLLRAGARRRRPDAASVAASADARHDALTGLPDRPSFRSRLAEALGRVQRRDGRVAVHCLDLDRFKDVNEALGHATGDALLCMAAERMRACLGEADTVARLGGDEFGVIQAGGAVDPAAAAGLAARLVAAFRRPFTVDGHELRISVCVGGALSPADGRDADELLRSAETALYAAKAEGPNRSRLFVAEMRRRSRARRTLELDLGRAIEAGSLALHYQPKFSLPDCRLAGMEALLRWAHPERGLVPPSEFIPVAEESGLIVPIGAWALRAACAQNRAWQRAGLPRMRVAVNLSAAQFVQPDGLVATVAGALEASGLEPDGLELEITEGVLLADTREVLGTLARLRDMGIRLALDDFGMGYSALGYLQRFAFDTLKIDRSFVAELDGGGGGVPIVRAVVDLAHGLNMTVVAEGVETAAQLTRLKTMACDAVQGFLLASPEPETAFAARLGAPDGGRGAW